MNAPRDPLRHGPGARPHPRPRTGRAMALVDARFIEWLGAPEGVDTGPRRDRLEPLLEAVLGQAGLPPDLARVYWYDNDAGGAKFNGQITRWTRPESVDGGASLALAMARDLAALADSSACDHVLLATDDDRLLVAVDASQQRGLRVHLLADESAQDLEALAKTDAAWSVLLRQADTRVIVAGAEVERALWGDGTVELAPRPPVARWRHSSNVDAVDLERPRREGRADDHDEFEARPGRDERMGHGHRDGREGREGRDGRDMRDMREGRESRQAGPSGPELQTMRTALQPLLADWWDGLPVEDREEFIESLPAQRGLPQEVDRQLLLRISQRLGRPLSFVEKKLMRELAREVCGDATGATPAASETVPAAPSP